LDVSFAVLFVKDGGQIACVIWTRCFGRFVLDSNWATWSKKRTHWNLTASCLITGICLYPSSKYFFSF